jgi:hypothetical protein
MTRIRNLQYAPEWLERKLCPSAMAGNLAISAPYSTPEPAASQNFNSLPSVAEGANANATAPDPAANATYLVALAPLETDSSGSMRGDSVDDNSDPSNPTNSAPAPAPDPAPAPAPDPAPDDPGPSIHCWVWARFVGCRAREARTAACCSRPASGASWRSTCRGGRTVERSTCLSRTGSGRTRAAASARSFMSTPRVGTPG